MNPDPADPRFSSDEENAVDTDDEELIAYLDGELDEPDARAVESKLALDPAIRARAEAYKQTYDLLDYLPKPEPSADFASRTVSRMQPAVVPASSASGSSVTLVAGSVSGSGSVASFPLETSWGRSWLVWVAAAILAVVGGFGAHAGYRSLIGPPPVNADTLPLSDLRVIERLPFYLGVDHLGFLRLLDQPDLFARNSSRSASSTADHTARHDLPESVRDDLIRLFMSYPVARREQLRTLDRELAALPAEEQARLTRVLEAYAVWLDRLPDGDRTAVLAASDCAARIEVIRQTREKHWRESLPVRQRDQLKLMADPQEVVALVSQWKDSEQQRIAEWELARSHWDELNRGPRSRPWPFAESTLTREIDQYIKNVLAADLSMKVEGKFDLPPSCRLDRAEFMELKFRKEAAEKEGYWLLYGACLWRLAERHPSLPPPEQGKPITDIQQIPKDLLKDLRAKRNAPDFGRVRGKWPEFALELADAAKKAKIEIRPPLGPAKPNELIRPVRQFVETKLEPALTTEESAALRKLEGEWPDYPRLLLNLAQRHDLPVPDVTLPGPPSLWRKYYGTPTEKP